MLLTEGHARQAKQKAILDSLRRGTTRRAACRLAGVNPTTFYRWLNGDDEEAIFCNAVMRAEAEAEVQVVGHIEKAAPVDWRAAQWIVEHHPQMREDWRKADDIDWSKVPTDVIRALLRDREDAGRIAAAGSGDPGGCTTE